MRIGDHSCLGELPPREANCASLMFESCVPCGPVRGFFYVCFAAVNGCAMLLVWRSRGLEDEFGIIAEHRCCLLLFLPSCAIHGAISTLFPHRVSRSWPLTLYSIAYIVILPCACHVVWPALRSFSKGDRMSCGCHTSHQRGGTLTAVLASPVGVHAFTKFLRREYCVENMLFWHAIDALRARAGATRRRSLLSHGEAAAVVNLPIAEVRRIHDDYICEGSVMEVNLPGQVRANLTRELENAAQQGRATILASVLDDSVDEILRLMQDDSFPRFLRSAEGPRRSFR